MMADDELDGDVTPDAQLTAPQFYAVRKALYRSNPAGYYACGHCGRELGVCPQHTPNCVVGRFERGFYRSEMSDEIPARAGCRLIAV